MNVGLGILSATGGGIAGGGLYNNEWKIGERAVKTGLAIGAISSIAQGISDGSITSAATSFGAFLGLSLVSAVASYVVTKMIIGDSDNSRISTVVATASGALLGLQYGVAAAAAGGLASNISFRWLASTVKI